MANPGWERLADTLQNVVNTLVGAKGSGRHPVKTLLNGTWLRHPVHPLLTDVAIGSAVLAGALDVVWLAVPGAGVWAPRAAEAVVIAAALGFIGAFFTGWTDWSDTYGPERSTGLWHGLLNSAALLLYIVSAILRLQLGDGRSVVAAVLGFIGLGTVSVAAYLGGHLVFRYGANVNHTAWEHGADDFEAIGPLERIADNALSRVVVGGVPVVLLRQGEKLAALAATCTHAGGPLDEGELLPGNVVKCPWHGSRFRMDSGRVVDGPATTAEPRYLVRVREGQVELKRA
jgi:nitrite reductase/ring-hydroxylating ferredoxin subunit/uncharacterized membrane protein